MNRLLTGYQHQFAVAYIDDVLCYSRDWNAHMEHLKLILERIHKSGLRLRAEKCQFALTKLRYLRMVISYDRIQPDPEKTFNNQKSNSAKIGQNAQIVSWSNWILQNLY